MLPHIVHCIRLSQLMQATLAAINCLIVLQNGRGLSHMPLAVRTT